MSAASSAFFTRAVGSLGWRFFVESASRASIDHRPVPFSQVEDVARIELKPQVVHQLQGDRVDLPTDKIPFFKTDTMLTRK